MRCKEHSFDLSSSVGVCAYCLRERLLSLIAAQAQAQEQAQAEGHRSKPQLQVLEDRRKSDPQLPPPLIFPRSVSPYISRRKSDTTTDWITHAGHHYHRPNSDQLFFSTPQVGPTASKKKHGFHVISNLFRSRSQKFWHSGPISVPESAPKVSRQSCEASSSTSSSSSWFSSFRNRGSRKKTSSSGDWCQQPFRRGRGMSPHIEELEEEREGSPWPCGYSPESANEWKKTPKSRQTTMKPSHGRVKSSPTRSNVVAFCLSPLVRIKPHGHWNNSGKGVAPEMRYPTR
ncbi:hypothetical protein Ancab_037268 [Ancistrocladus abbreviatus]